MKLLTCCPSAKKRQQEQGSGASCGPHTERCHRTKMNKAQILELFALSWVYRDVEWLYGIAQERG